MAAKKSTPGTPAVDTTSPSSPIPGAARTTPAAGPRVTGPTKGTVFTPVVLTWAVIFTVMAVSIGSLSDESEVFSFPPAPRFAVLTTMRNYFASVGQRVGDAMTPAYQRMHELLFVDPVEHAAATAFAQLQIGSLFVEQKYGRQWQTCGQLADRLDARTGRKVNRAAFCSLLHLAGHTDLLERHTAKTVADGDDPRFTRVSYSLSFLGASLSDKHSHSLVGVERDLHQALLGSQLAQAIVSSLYDNDSVPNPAAVAAYARSYDSVLAAAPTFAACQSPQTVRGADALTVDAGADCLLLKAVLPFHSPSSLRDAVAKATARNVRVYFVELVHNYHLHHMLNRFTAAADVFLAANGVKNGLSTQTTAVLNAQPTTTGTPFLIFPIENANQIVV